MMDMGRCVMNYYLLQLLGYSEAVTGVLAL